MTQGILHCDSKKKKRKKWGTGASAKTQSNSRQVTFKQVISESIHRTEKSLRSKYQFSTLLLMPRYAILLEKQLHWGSHELLVNIRNNVLPFSTIQDLRPHSLVLPLKSRLLKEKNYFCYRFSELGLASNNNHALLKSVENGIENSHAI